jgi:hypothetical protein
MGKGRQQLFTYVSLQKDEEASFELDWQEQMKVIHHN